jgi:hypothetical protein
LIENIIHFKAYFKLMMSPVEFLLNRQIMGIPGLYIIVLNIILVHIIPFPHIDGTVIETPVFIICHQAE